MQEYELKFLNIDVRDLEETLHEIGAQKVGDFHYRRKVFDYPDFRLDNDGAWIRLRDEGNKIMLGYKQRLGWKEAGASGTDLGMEEIEFEVSDFDKTAAFLYKLGLADKFYQENKRTRYVKDDIEFDIDTWPLLEPYLEIEGQSHEKVEQAIALLGLNLSDAKQFTTTQIYELAGINDKDYIKLTFDEAVKRM